MFDVVTLTRTRPRTNEEWLHGLRNTGPAGQAAIQALWDHLERTVCFYLCRQRSDLAGLDPDELHQLAEDCTQEALLIVQAKLSAVSSTRSSERWPSLKLRAGYLSLIRCGPEELLPEENDRKGGLSDGYRTSGLCCGTIHAGTDSPQRIAYSRRIP